MDGGNRDKALPKGSASTAPAQSRVDFRDPKEARMALQMPDNWLAEMKRAGSLAARGVPGAALRLLDHLYSDVRAAGREALGDWHRVQILWVKATILEEAGRY